MDVKKILDAGVTQIMNAGALSTVVNIISFTFASGTYDDNVTQTLTGSQVVDGLLFPINSKFGSSEAMLLEQGKLLTKDKILFVGSVSTSGNILIGIGNDRYSIIPDGVITYGINGSDIFNKIYLRQTIAGSLY